jgi:hypothetical protein
MTFRARLAFAALVVAGCGKNEPPPARSPEPASPVAGAPPDAAPVDPCAAARQEVADGNQAYAAEIVRQGFTPEVVRRLPTGTDVAARGAAAAAEREMARAAQARRVFAGKQTGDVVTYTVGANRHRGLYIGTPRPFQLGRKDGRLFVLEARAVRTVRCDDPHVFRSDCGQPETNTVIEAPPGQWTFGGVVTIAADRFELDASGGKAAACPP